MDSIAQQYIELAHDIERLDPGYIDGYFGPEEWKGTGTRTLDEMAGAVQELTGALRGIDDKGRREFLTAQVCAMQTKIGLLRGEPISYASEVRGLYDIEPVHIAEAVFDEAISALDDVLPGTGSIEEREQRLRQRFVVDPEKVPALINAIIPEFRRRTLEFVDLPEGEGFETRMVTNEPWSAYNWYLGNSRSRVDVNTDLPTYLVVLPDTIAHEAYPGHHTEHVLKDSLLWHEAQRGEHSILLINAPECVISEGIATRARRAVMTEDELADWLEQDLAPLAGMQELPIREMLLISKTRRELRNVTNNAALLLHGQRLKDADILEYIRKYRLATDEEARKSLSFIKHPNFRSYGFTYTVGADLLDDLFETKGSSRDWFKRLLTEPVTPGGVREWISG